MDFTEKNRRRREARASTDRDVFLQRRRLRRQRLNGAFGKCRPAKFNFLAVGTMATPRHAPDKDEAVQKLASLVA